MRCDYVMHYSSVGKVDFVHSLIPRHQIFRARPAALSKNRVWTLSLRKLGQVYLRRSVNWVIVGVNYIISYRQRLLWRQNICKLAVCDDA